MKVAAERLSTDGSGFLAGVLLCPLSSEIFLSKANRAPGNFALPALFKAIGFAGMGLLNVFDLDRTIVSDYERFARSFTQIRAPDIRSEVEAIYANDRFWPEPLISINPHFERGTSI